MIILSCENCKKTERSEEVKKTLKSRVNRITGQMNAIGKMIDEDRYCADILIQLSAIDKSIKSLSNIILSNHMKHCVKNATSDEVDEKIDEVIDLIRRFN